MTDQTIKFLRLQKLSEFNSRMFTIFKHVKNVTFDIGRNEYSWQRNELFLPLTSNRTRFEGRHGPLSVIPKFLDDCLKKCYESYA